MKIVAVDTETVNEIPFIATVTNQRLQSRLFVIKNRSNYMGLKRICESPNITKVFHSASYDIYCLSKIGILVVPPYEDTMIAAPLLNENYSSKKLKVLAQVHLGEPCDEAKELSKVKAKYKREAKKKGIDWNWSMIPSKILYPYAIKDTIYTIKLWFLFKRPLRKYIELYKFEKELIPVVVKMQQKGFLIDRKFCKKMVKYCNKNLDILKHKLRRISGKEDFNPSSFKQVGEVIVKLDIPITEKTKKDSIATDSDTLKKYIKYPFIRLLMKYRFHTKQLSTYYGPLYYRYTSSKNKIAHFLFYQSGAKTGRFTAQLIHQIPRMEDVENTGERQDVRKAFLCRPGYTMVCVDYDQIEMRLFAHFSNAIRFIKHILNGFDAHLGTAYDLFGKHIVEKSKKIKKKLRKIAKDINFGIIYGMGQRKLASSLNLPAVKAYDILQKYYRRYPVKEYIRSVTSQLFKQGSISLSFDSELMNFSREYRVPQDKAYRGTNVIIQGTAAYVMKKGMLRTAKWIDSKNLDVNLLATMHDELIFEINNKYNVDKVIKKLIRLMEDRVTFKVPMLASAKISNISWGHAAMQDKWKYVE